MQVFQTAGVPPSIGRIILAIIGWTRKSRNALRKMVPDHRAAMPSYLLRYEASSNLVIRCTLSIPFSVRSTTKATPVAAKTALARAPIFAVLNPAVGMAQVGSTDPPEESNRTEAG